MKLQCPISRILLPVDGSKHSKRAVQFAGCLGASMGKSLSGVTLLHVLTGGYLSRHMANIDFRTKIVQETDLFKRIKETHIKSTVNPMLDEWGKLLKDLGIEVPVEKVVVEGDAANEILRVANEGNYSTIIMARRGLSKLKGAILGSVTSKVAHTATRQTVYIVGQRIVKDEACLLPKILVPVDGSIYAMRGVEHTACLASMLKAVKRITLLGVINLALYEQRQLGGTVPTEEANRILEEAKAVFLRAGIDDKIIKTEVKVGNPSEEILKEAEKEEYTIIVIGRKGRGAIKDLLLGGVSATVLNRCKNPTVAIVS